MSIVSRLLTGRIVFRFLQIFFCRSMAHSAISAKLVPKAFGTQTVAAVPPEADALFRQERRRKISDAAQTNPAYCYIRKLELQGIFCYSDLV